MRHQTRERLGTIASIREQIANMRAAVGPDAEAYNLSRESLVGYVRKMCDHADRALVIAEAASRDADSLDETR